jgi:hypothetical protein
MKINIENYENMTTEEKLAALENYEPDMSGFVSKSVFDKTASDLAAAKKSLKEKMTEDEAKAEKEAEERAALLARVEELEREKSVSKYVNAYLSMGYDEKLAKSSAEALQKGDMDVVFANQKAFTENREKTLRAEKIQQTPAPEGGAKNDAMTLEKIRAMTPSERYEFSVKNPEEYKNLYGGN